MESAILGVCIAGMTASVVATVATLAPGQAVQNWIRRVCLVLFNLSPWTIGMWRRSFTRRETLLAGWFLCFVLTLVLYATLVARTRSDLSVPPTHQREVLPA
jgi:hypothetical protein